MDDVRFDWCGHGPPPWPDCGPQRWAAVWLSPTEYAGFLAAVWQDPAGFVGWVNEADRMWQVIKPTEREARAWCEDRLRKAASTIRPL